MKTILLSIIISISIFAQDWTYFGAFPNSTFMGNTGGTGVAVDPDGKVWCMFYGATSRIRWFNADVYQMIA